MAPLRILAALLPLALAVPTKRDGGTAFLVGQNYADEWAAFQTGTGKTPAGISVYGDIWSGALNSDSDPFLSSYAGANSGYVEVGMSWKDAMTQYGYTEYQGGILCTDIANGKYDDNLNKLATTLAQYPNVNYLFRVDYEVSTNLHANTDPSNWDPSTQNLTAYPAAFAHVRQVIGSQVKNIEFVYHAVRGQGALLYPGDDVVDWNGISIFNNDVCLPVGPTTNCVGDTIDPNVQKDLDWMPKKKMICESAVQPPSSSTSDGFINYLTLVKTLVEKNGVSAWTYINSDWTNHGWPADTWGDSRVEANPDVLSWWNTNIANGPYTFG